MGIMHFVGQRHLLWLGLLFIVCIVFFPGGIAGVFAKKGVGDSVK